MPDDPKISEWGNLCRLIPACSNLKVFFLPAMGEGTYRVADARPGEVKHLSNRRKRKKTIDSASSGERKRKSPNRGVFPLGL
jgi:hypothetical protein